MLATMYRRIALATSLIATFLLAVPTWPFAAELRTTVAERPVHRTVSFEEPLPQKEVAQEWSEEPVWSGACTSCGADGCSLACLKPCGYWADLEYLLWWRSGYGTPPLVTGSNDPTNTAQADAGVLGISTTDILFGGSKVGGNARPGGRVSLGVWLDDSGCYAVEGRFYVLGRETVQFNANSLPILARPFIDPGVGNTSRLLDYDGFTDNGIVNITGTSDVLGGDVLLRKAVCSDGCWDVQLLMGYQFARIDEDLVISDSLTTVAAGGLISPGTQQDIVDRFDVRNEFQGGQFGIEATYWADCWRLETIAKVALGNMNQVVDISGQTVSTVPGDPNPGIQNVGLLANTGNVGRHEQDEFAAVPEIGATLVFQAHECVDLSAGYSFIYFSKVAQPGEQIDPTLNVPSTFQLNTGSYWLHGLRFGGELRF